MASGSSGARSSCLAVPRISANRSADKLRMVPWVQAASWTPDPCRVTRAGCRV